jgi:stage II sporulation protein D
MRLAAAAALAALVLCSAASAGTVFLLDGRGWGHGVGMSQWGAEGYARHGYGYRQILAHYYPTTHIAIAAAHRVRVLLARGQRSVRMGSASPFLVIDAMGRRVHLHARSVVVDRRFVLRHERLAPPLHFEAGAQPLQVGFRGYRGDVLVKAKPDGLMVVNDLPLDRYLRGVVPWEVPKGWHEDTYEAQAVAARSYTLATLHPGADFDQFPDTRSQMYGGIRAERPETNRAVGATAGQVLVWRDRIIEAFYFSASGGRTSSVHDAFPRLQQVPYLASVRDPYDYISPHHVWPTALLTPARVGAVLHLRDVRDVRVVRNSSGRAAAVRVRWAGGWRRFGGRRFEQLFGLGSADFEINAMSLNAPPARALFGDHLRLSGFVRGLGRARLQERTPAGWITVRELHLSARGTFVVSLRPRRSTQLRLAYNAVAGEAVSLNVVPRVTLQTLGSQLRVLVSPRLPLRVQRLRDDRWQQVGSSMGVFRRRVGPGSYRVSVPGAQGYAAAISRAVTVRPA